MPLPRPGWRIPHRRTHISRSPLLLREVRRGFSEERQFHFQLAVAALELPHPLVIRHSFRERLPGTLLPVCFHPKAEGGVIYFEFPRYLGDRQGVIDYLPGSLLLELRSVSFRFSRHSFPSFPGENPTGSPVRKRWGTSVGQIGRQRVAVGVDVDEDQAGGPGGDAGHRGRFATPPGHEAIGVGGGGADAVAPPPGSQAGAVLDRVRRAAGPVTAGRAVG